MAAVTALATACASATGDRAGLTALATACASAAGDRAGLITLVGADRVVGGTGVDIDTSGLTSLLTELETDFDTSLFFFFFAVVASSVGASEVSTLADLGVRFVTSFFD